MRPYLRRQFIGCVYAGIPVLINDRCPSEIDDENSSNSTNLSRRTILGTGIAAAGVLTTLAPVPLKAADAEPELVSLYNQYRVNERILLDATQAADEAEFAARDEFPKAPYSLIWRHSDGTPHYNNTGEPMILTSSLFDPENLPEDVRADLLAYESTCNVVREKHNCAALRQAAEALEEESTELWEAIASTPAQSLLGVAIKVALGISNHEDCETTMEFAARRDALRLAGLPDDFGEQ